jgi:PEGA domain-containing protein
MLSKRVVVVAADKALAKRAAAGLMAAGATVEIVANHEELARGEVRADLVVLQVPALAEEAEGLVKAVADRLGAGARLVVLIPASSLELTVRAARAGRVDAVLVVDELETRALAAVASRLLFGDIFGLEKVVPWGVKIYSMLVGDYQEKSVAIAAVSDFAAALGVRRKYREAIEQCLDEMLMNALYDAPVDAAGKQMFADVPTKTRISLRMEQKATVEYACDGSMFALSVRDSFGTLRGETVLRYLDKCLHADQQIDRKAGGAGLGLYIICNAATQFLISVQPNVATEVTCTFDLGAAKVQLLNFGVFSERIDSSGRLVAGRSRLHTSAKLPAQPVDTGPPRTLAYLLVAAIAAIIGLIAIVAYPRVRGAGRAALAVTTRPAGAVIEIDGAAKGTTGATPLVVGDLTVGEKYKVTASRDGYETTMELVTPHNGTTALELALKPRGATLVVATVPPGAKVYLDDKEVGTTPLPIAELEPRSTHKVRLTKPGYNDLTQTVTVPDPGARTEAQLYLVRTPELSSIRIESDPPGAEILQNGELLAGLKTPVGEQMLQVGRTYSFTLRQVGFMPETVTVTAKKDTTDPIFVKMKRGGLYTLETNVPEARVTVAGVAACQARSGPVVDCPLENGKYRVRLASLRPFVAESWNVVMNSEDMRHKVDFGFVETATDEVTLKIPGAPADTHRAAFTDGEYRVTLVNAKNGLTIIKPVKIVAGRTVKVDAKQ